MRVALTFGFCFVLSLTLWLHPAAAAASQNKPQLQAAETGAPPAKATVGKATVYSLQDVSREMDTSIFRGADAETIRGLAPSGKAPSSIYTFLIKLGGNTILVDTGLGKRENPASQLHAKLAAIGVAPQDVTHVLLTHMHGDHVGGLAWDGKAAFPKATVMVSTPEKDYWLAPDTLEKNPGRKDNIALIKNNLALYGDKVKTFALGSTPLPGISSVAAVGHTPGHTAFLLESGGHKLLFWGDAVHAAALQFPNPKICASYDMDVTGAIAVRMALMELAAHSKIPVAGAHLPAPGMGRVTQGKDKDGFAFTPGL